MLVDRVRSALRLSAVDPAALAAGLGPGLTLADARARVPDLVSLPCQPAADTAFLARLLEDFGRFSPMVALDPPHGLMLDVTGCAHLFGGERRMLERVRARGEAAGLCVRAALASTAQAARALARHGAGGVFPPGEDRLAVRRLAIDALELSEREHQALYRAGLRTLADLDDRPRAPLAARFGADFPARLARVLADEDMRITPHRPPPACVADRMLAEPITEQPAVEQVLGDLLMEAADRLDQRGLGGRSFEAAFFRVDGEVRRVGVRTGQPTREPSRVMRLFRERLAALETPLDAGFGFDQLRLSVLWTQPLAPTQRTLEPRPPGAEDLARLVDLLTVRLGASAVVRLEPAGSHMPERAARAVPAGAPRTAAQAWPTPDPDDPPMRPLQLFNPPQPVEVIAEVPDGAPRRFRWRRVMHEVAAAEGPERIAGEWWRAPGQRARDYYRVEDRQGRRFWLFRQGMFDERPEPRWFIHGLFA